MENSMPDFLANVPLIFYRELHFMHDGAPAHFSLSAHRYLNRKLPGQWIGRGGPIVWPSRSSDLNTLDFFLSGHLKSLVYLSPVDDVETPKLNCGRFTDNAQHARNSGSSSGINEASS
jgi:hypothetical protein